MNCSELFVRHRTFNYQKLLADFEEKLLSFQDHVIQLNKSVGIKTCKVGVSYLEKNFGDSKEVLFKKHSESANLFKAPGMMWQQHFCLNIFFFLMRRKDCTKI